MLNKVTGEEIDYKMAQVKGVSNSARVDFGDVFLKTDHEIKNAMYKLQGISGKGPQSIELRPQ
jgi:hypothetical protein